MTIEWPAHKASLHLTHNDHKSYYRIVMAIVDKIVADVVRPGPTPEERECYEMAGEVRALVPDLEELAAKIIKNEPVE